MEQITSLIKQLKSAKHTTPADTAISYATGDGFWWDPNRLCIHFAPSQPHSSALLLHELGHALLGHDGYNRDVELLTLERAAWDAALVQAAQYGVSIPDHVIEDHLDTYRDWLHARSLCPQCDATGLQEAARAYRCLSCGNHWRVNEARTCGLKRYHIAK